MANLRLTPFAPTHMHPSPQSGVDASTQIEPQDGLFKFDIEVDPILEVLVGKTLEQGLQEVREEAELEALKLHKEELLRNKVCARHRETHPAAQLAACVSWCEGVLGALYM